MFGEPKEGEVYKIPIFAVTGKYAENIKHCQFCKHGLPEEYKEPKAFIEAALNLIPGVKVKNIIIDPGTNTFDAWGDVIRIQKREDPFTEPVSSEFRVTLEASGLSIDSVGFDLDDETMAASH
jgi:hypothetical protein